MFMKMQIGFCFTLLMSCVMSAGAVIDGFNADGMPFAKKGFGVRRNFYLSGRISAKVADVSGIFELNYVGRQPFQRQRFYSSNEQCAFMRCVVPQVIIDGMPYRLKFENTVHYPFGYTSECTVDGVKLKHELVLDRNALFRRITVLDNPQGKSVLCRVVQMNPGMEQGAVWRIDRTRNVLCARASFPDGTAVAMEIGAKNPVAFPVNSLRDRRAFPHTPDATQDFRFEMTETSAVGSHLFWCVFDKTPDENLSDARIERVFSDFAARRATDIRFKTGDATVDGWLGFIVPMSAAYEVDGSGAFRASPTYWVWGWDAMVHAGTLAFCGRADGVRRMLTFFRDRALKSGSIHHSFTTDLSFNVTNNGEREDVCFDVVNASFWLILLNEYVNATGDEQFKAACMPFARMLAEKNRAYLKPGELLPRGQGWIPDNRYPLQQEGCDFTLANSSVYWQGLCAWRELSGEDFGVDATAAELVAKFWDAETGYWGDSWDVAAGKRRDWRPLHGLYAVSPFARDVVPGDPAAVCAFMERTFRVGDRLAMYAADSTIRCADGNQFGAYYPVQDRTFWTMQNLAGRSESLPLYRRIVARHGRVLTYPEGQTADVVNDDPEDYSDELGNKQFFASKGWLADVFDLWLGLRLSKDGISLKPMNDGRPFAVYGLSLREKTLDIELSGTGTRAAYRFNGKDMKKGFVPWTEFVDGKNVLMIRLTDRD